MLTTRDAFLRSVLVLDTETTNLHAEKADIVEIAGARYDGANWQVKSMLLGAIGGIPAEASAKNHISNPMIAGLPTFAEIPQKIFDMMTWNENESMLYVAHNSRYDQEVLARAWNSCDGYWKGNAEIAKDPMRWICTHRLSKQLLDVDFDDMQYNLSFLRYKLDLPIASDTPVHRAAGDTLTCAVLFEFLVEYAIATGRVIEGVNEDGIDLATQIFCLCWEPQLKKKWPFGKHKGQLLTDLPTDYYVWALSNLDVLNEKSSEFDNDLAESIKLVLEKRLES